MINGESGELRVCYMFNSVSLSYIQKELYERGWETQKITLSKYRAVHAFDKKNNTEIQVSENGFTKIIIDIGQVFKSIGLAKEILDSVFPKFDGRLLFSCAQFMNASVREDLDFNAPGKITVSGQEYWIKGVEERITQVKPLETSVDEYPRAEKSLEDINKIISGNNGE